MKKELCAGACACLLLAGCGTVQAQNTGPSVSTKATVVETQPTITMIQQTVPPTTIIQSPKYPSIDETVVYDDGSFKLTAKEIDFSNSLQVRIKFLIENSSDKNIAFNGNYFTVNGITVPGYMYLKAAAGKKANDYVTFGLDNLEFAGISDIATIVAQDAHIVDTDSFQTLAEAPFELDTSISGDYVQEIDDSGQTIIDNNGIVVKYRGVSETWDKIGKLDFYVDNSSDQNVNIMVKDISVNGFTIYGNMVARAYSNCATYDSITFLSDDFKTNDIESIDDVSVRLYACDSSTFRTLWTTEEIQLGPDPEEQSVEQTDASGMMPPNDILASIKDATGGTFYDFQIENSDGFVLITCTFPGMGQGAPLLQSGDSTLLEKWQPFVESQKSACKAVTEYLANLGYDVPVKWVLLNDLDTSKSLLESINGEITYDISKDGK